MHKVELARESFLTAYHEEAIAELVPGQLTADQRTIVRSMVGKRCLVSITVTQVEDEQPGVPAGGKV
jgi:hypothetical protein